jgi:cytoskeletal protein RodZ
MKEELGESLDHLVQAANHAAGGVGATVGPRWDAARDRVGPTAGKVRTVAATGLGTTVAALAPLAVSAKEGARKSKGRSIRTVNRKTDRSPRRWPRLTMLLVAGAAVGAAGAMVLRRRRQLQWEEYDPSRPQESAADSAKGATHQAAHSVATTAEELAGKASSAIDSARSKGSSSGSTQTSATTPKTGTSTPVPGAGIASSVSGAEFPSTNNRT